VSIAIEEENASLREKSSFGRHFRPNFRED
jgi:hypothetical protein